MTSWINYANLLCCHANLFSGYVIFQSAIENVPTCVLCSNPMSNFSANCLLVTFNYQNINPSANLLSLKQSAYHYLLSHSLDL